MSSFKSKLPSTLIGILLGIIGALLGYFSLVLSVSSEATKLEKLLNDSKSFSTYDERIKEMEFRISSLEESIIAQARVLPYMKLPAVIPTDIQKKQEVFRFISSATNNRSNKQTIFSYIIQSEDNNIREIALKKFIELADSSDIDGLIFLNISYNGRFFDSGEKLQSIANKNNFSAIVSSILKYMTQNDLRASFLILRLYTPRKYDPGEKKIEYRYPYLHSLLALARENQLKECVSAIEKVLILKSELKTK